MLVRSVWGSWDGAMNVVEYSVVGAENGSLAGVSGLDASLMVASWAGVS